MSLNALKLSGSSMKSIQTGIDSISHDIANINTTAYKKNKVSFEAIVSDANNGTFSGTNVNSINPEFSQGSLRSTGNLTDLAIKGKGFFTLQNAAAEVVYSRAGNFSVDANSNIVDPNGNFLLGTGAAKITLPTDIEAVQINAAGEVLVKRNGVEQFEFLDQVQLATFVNDTGLLNVGGNLYKASANSGAAVFSTAQGQGTATQSSQVIAGALESSNVDLSTSLVDLMSMQRSYQAASRVTSTASDLLEITIGLSQ